MHAQGLTMVRVARGVGLVLPWRMARALFRPRMGDGPRNRLLERLAFWRAMAGLLLVVFVPMGWRPPHEALVDVYGQVMWTALFSAGVVGVLLLWLLNLARDWSEFFRGTARMLGRIGLACLAIVAPLVYLIIALSVAGDGTLRGWVAAPVSWLTVHALCVVYWAARTCLWTSDFHPLLGPLGTALVLSLVTFRELSSGDSDGLPVALWVVLNLGGLATSLILCGAEYRHLRNSGMGF